MRIAHVSTASIALLLVLCGPAARGGVGIESVTPGQGVPDRETTLTVDGSSFAPGSRVSLLDGGPLLAATIPIADSQAMALRGTLLYVAAGTSLSVVDVASPATPVTLGTVDLGLYPTFLVADGDRLYLGRGYDGVVVFDLADPLHPLRRGSAPVNGYLLAGAISGPWLHVAANDSGFATLDVSDPDHPFVAGTLALPTGYAEAVARLDATHVLVAFAGYGLVVLDVSAPGGPRSKRRCPAPASPT